jgi:nucleolar complex protein 2
MGNVNFMMNGVVELYALDFAVGYQHAFVYIRELAVALRKALQQKTKEAFRKVFSNAAALTELI